MTRHERNMVPFAFLLLTTVIQIRFSYHCPIPFFYLNLFNKRFRSTSEQKLFLLRKRHVVMVSFGLCKKKNISHQHQRWQNHYCPHVIRSRGFEPCHIGGQSDEFTSQ